MGLCCTIKPEVHIAKLVDMIGTKVQLLYIYMYIIYIYIYIFVCVFMRSSYPIGLKGVYCDVLPESVIKKWRP